LIVVYVVVCVGECIRVSFRWVSRHQWHFLNVGTANIGFHVVGGGWGLPTVDKWCQGYIYRLLGDKEE